MQSPSPLTTKPLRQVCGNQEGNMTRLLDCVARNTFNLSETIHSVVAYTDTNTAAEVNVTRWKSSMTYTHTGVCHTMQYDRLISNAPLVLILNTSPGQGVGIMMHDRRST